MLNIKKVVKGAVSNVGIPMNVFQTVQTKAQNPMASYQAMNFDDIQKAEDVLDRLIAHMVSGNCKSLLISGPAGSGKSSSVQRLLKKHNAKKVASISGSVSPVRTYIELYRNREPGEILVLDDADRAYMDIDGMNIIKAATDTLDHRQISWMTASPLLRTWGVPNTFSYSGSMILITNEPLDTAKRGKAGVHLKALADRLHHLHLGESNIDEQFRRLCYFVVKHGLLRSRGLQAHQERSVLDFIFAYKDRLPEITLRTATKLADLVLMEPDAWMDIGYQSLCSGDGGSKKGGQDA